MLIFESNRKREKVARTHTLTEDLQRLERGSRSPEELIVEEGPGQLRQACAEPTASPDANRNLKAVAESVPTVQSPEASFSIFYFSFCNSKFEKHVDGSPSGKMSCDDIFPYFVLLIFFLTMYVRRHTLLVFINIAIHS
jgi:hypothetical protein